MLGSLDGKIPMRQMETPCLNSVGAERVFCPLCLDKAIEKLAECQKLGKNVLRTLLNESPGVV